MTIVRLLFALNQKGVKLSAGKRGRIRFNPRDQVSGAMREAIRVHGDAIRELLRDGDVESWRMIRLDKPQADDPPEDAGGDYLDDDYEPDVELEYRLWREELERERDSIVYSEQDDLGTEPRPFVIPSPGMDDGNDGESPVPF